MIRFVAAKARATFWGIAVVLAAVWIAGCAGTGSRIPIENIKMVSGKWEGYYTRKSGSRSFRRPATFTINEDGTFEMTTNLWTSKGRTLLKDGGIVFSNGFRASGTAALYEGKDGQELISGSQRSQASFAWSAAWTRVEK